MCAGFKHSCGIRSGDGKVVCWGRNHEGQCNAYEDEKDLFARSLDCGYGYVLIDVIYNQQFAFKSVYISTTTDTSTPVC